LDEYDPTTIDGRYRQLVIDDEVAILDVQYTAGQEEYSAMGEQFIRTGDGFMLMYSITNRCSLEELTTYQQQILRVKDKHYWPMIVVGNHCSKEGEREVTRAEGEDLAQSFGCKHVEADSEGRINVDAAFYGLVLDIRRYNLERRRLELPWTKT
jgi:GTPase KRas protein